MFQVDDMFVQQMSFNKEQKSTSEHNSVSLAKPVKKEKIQDSDRQGIELNLTLQTFHYRNGRLNLRCTAKIANIYEESSELQLGSTLREPVPERGKRK